MFRLLALGKTIARPVIFNSVKARGLCLCAAQNRGLNSLLRTSSHTLLVDRRTLTSQSGQADRVDNRKWICGYEDIQELHSASENVKRIFSLDNANQYEHRKVSKSDLDKKYSDYSERTVAELTLKISTLERHCKEKPKDKHNKVFLLWLIDQRKKKLKHLKLKNFERYLQLTKELDIPALESTHSKWNKYKFRKFKIGVEVKEKRSYLDRKIIT